MLAQQIKEELNSFKMVRVILLSLQCSANTISGDGGSRVFQASHAFLLMIMHPSFGHGVLAKPFHSLLLCIGATAFTS
jgi:hypothetical protein